MRPTGGVAWTVEKKCFSSLQDGRASGTETEIDPDLDLYVCGDRGNRHDRRQKHQTWIACEIGFDDDVGGSSVDDTLQGSGQHYDCVNVSRQRGGRTWSEILAVLETRTDSERERANADDALGVETRLARMNAAGVLRWMTCREAQM